ncbi:hypothetical protein MTO96_028253 [Rhipicephalus appendiculatus]
MRQGGRSIVSKVLRASKMPRLPRDDIKIIVRPRDGLNIRSTCGVSLDEAIRNGAGLGDDEMITICPNPTQNILVISTPEEKTALKIAKIKVLTIDGKSPRATTDPDLAARMESMEKENKELIAELARARKQNEKSNRKIEELQQTLNEILKRMGGHSGGMPSSCTSAPCEAAERGDATAAGGEGETYMCCGSDEAPAAVGSKRKSPSGAQPLGNAENHAQEPKRPRPGTRKIDAIEEMNQCNSAGSVNPAQRAPQDCRSLENSTLLAWGFGLTLLTRLDESDVERNEQYAAVNAQLAAVNKRIEDLERGTVQLQQQQRHEPGGAGFVAPTPPTRRQEGRTDSRVPPPTPLNNHHGCVPQVRRQTHSLAVEL